MESGLSTSTQKEEKQVIPFAWLRNFTRPLKCFHSGWFEFTNKGTLNIETKKTDGRKRPNGPLSLPFEFLFSF